MLDRSLLEAALQSQNPGLRLARKALKYPVNGLLRGFLSVGFNQLTTAEGYKITIPATTSIGLYLSLRSGSYEGHEKKLLRECFEPADNIIEAGSNMGVIAAIALNEKLKNGGHMTCFEANADLIPVLQENIQRVLNMTGNLSKSCAIHNAAIGVKEDDKAEFLVRSSLGSGLGQYTERRKGDKAVSVPVISLEKAASRYPDGYSLICDIEGGEIGLIFEQASALAGCSQMMIELHEPKDTGSDVTPEMMVAELRNLGFKRQAQSGNCHYLVR
jgi:FkbM family methyltransferase